MKHLATLLLWLLLPMLSFPQQITKKSLSHSDYDNWKVLSKPSVSNNAQWISYEINPQKGDGFLFCAARNLNAKDSVSRGQGAIFSSTSDLLVFTIKQPEDSIRKLKLAKKKKDEMPKDTLGIWLLEKDSIIRIAGLKSLSLPKEGGAWVAVLCEKPKESKKDTLQKQLADSSQNEMKQLKENMEKEKKKKKGAWSDVETYSLLTMNPLAGVKFEAENVVEVSWSKNGCLSGYIKLTKNATDTTSVYIYDTHTEKVEKVFEKQGFVKKLTLDNQGNQAVFLYTADTGKVKRYSLMMWDRKRKSTQVIADTSNGGIPSGWEVSENGNISFSDDDTKIYFRTAPKILPQPKDTIPDDEKVKVDVWHYRDPRLQTQQLKELDDDLKRSYLAVYRIPAGQVVQLADSAVPDVKTYRKGNADIALGSTDYPYQMLSSWEDADYRDYYLIDTKTGSRKLILEKQSEYADLSPEGKYFLWYETADSSWNSLNLATNERRNLTSAIPVPFYNELFDMPSIPNPYGIAGWTEKDALVLVYDRYDIWALDPSGTAIPVNLTQSGRISKTSHRYIKLDPEAMSIDPVKPLLIKNVDEVTCSQGFSKLIFKKKGVIMKQMISADFEFSNMVKSRDTDVLLWQKSNYRVFPDLWISDLDFTAPLKITDANPQQSDYYWGTVEKVAWTSYDGTPLKGLLYKPEDFSPDKKYPVIVYFYERYSDKLHAHYAPSPSRSVINFTLYNSNGYVVFVPDIVYGTGHPGDDACKAIMSGTEALLKNPWIDGEHMGLQGQSWGGYQTAYMVTRTNLFKAAMAGAAVSNMTSAYAGIRWESGVVRQFQYEKSQSRIGGTLWERRDDYIANSPVFFADRISTPLLLMNNDNDGAVPWYQGIELFTALRRLGKPVWLLNYNGDEHNLTKRPNRQDLSIRMMQFFDVYLKEIPPPLWMKDGIPAVDKGKKLKYELSK